MKSWPKWLNPEIAFGALLATLFWLSVLGWQSAYAPTEIEKQACQKARNDHGLKTEDCKTVWERTTTDPVALYTFGLLLFTGVLGISTIGLWRQTRKAADAARIAAEHIPIVEGAYVYARLAESLSEVEATILNEGEEPRQAARFAIVITLKNYGKTPAVIDGIWANLSFASAAAGRTGGDTRIHGNTVIGAGEEYPPVQVIAPDLSTEEAANVKRFAAQLILQGRLTYTDIWETTWVVEFSGRYTGGRDRRFRVDNAPREKKADR